MATRPSVTITFDPRAARAAEIFFTDTVQRIFKLVRDEDYPDPETLRAIVFTLTNHIGESEPISLPLLATINEVSPRQMRKLLEILTVRYEVPIGAHSHTPGRWIIETEEERGRVLKDLYSRRNAIDARINAIARAKLPPSPQSLEMQVQQSIQPALPLDL